MPSWQGKNVYEGSYWSSTLRRHVRFESFLEREYIVSADFDQDAVAFQWQPFALKWPRGTKGHRGHVPDYFVRLRSGDGLVVDVKRPDRVHDEKVVEQFAMTRELCEGIGWHYQVFSGLADARRHNLQFLTGFRQDRYSPTAPLRELIAEAFTGGPSIEFGVARIQASEIVDPSHVLGHLWHEIWMGRIDVDLDTPLDFTSTATTSEEALQPEVIS